jgi:hypothetical protein
LQQLIVCVYCASYGDHPNDVTCTLTCTPRIQISSVDELVKLYEVGLLPGKPMSRIMSMLVGEHIPNTKGVLDFVVRTPPPPVLKQ